MQQGKKVLQSSFCWMSNCERQKMYRFSILCHSVHKVFYKIKSWKHIYTDKGKCCRSNNMNICLIWMEKKLMQRSFWGDISSVSFQYLVSVSLCYRHSDWYNEQCIYTRLLVLYDTANLVQHWNQLSLQSNSDKITSKSPGSHNRCPIHLS